MTTKRWLILPVSALLAIGVAACGGDDGDGNGGGGGGGNLSGTIKIDGSSTVFPFAQAAAEQFQTENPNVKITVGQSGTGGGFEKFCAGETDITDASRPIDADEEVPLCKDGGVEYTELEVARDGVSIASNPSLEIECLTTDELKQLWATDQAKTYADVNGELPDTEVSLYGPGTDSGTFEFFTEEVNGEEGRTRKDYQPSEDDNVLVQGVAGDEAGLGYFGYSYYEQNQDKLNLIGIDAGSGCVEPSLETIQSGEYEPLSRPLYMYPSKKALKRPEVTAFMEFILDNYEVIAQNAQIVPMSAETAAEAKQKLGPGQR